MSTTLIEYEAREARAKQLAPMVESAIKIAIDAAKEAVGVGYELGDHLEHLRKWHKQDEGTWMLSICPNQDVSRFALRTARICRSKGIDDPNQMFLALMMPSDSEHDENRPMRAQGTDIEKLDGYTQKISLMLAKWGGDNVVNWPKHRRDAFVRAVSPLAELLKKVQEVEG